MILIKKIKYYIIISGLLAASLVLAQPGGLRNPIDAPDFATLVRSIANLVAYIGGIAAVIFIIYSGFLFVTARGSEEQLKKAKVTFMWTIVGAGVLLGAYVIASAVVNLVQGLGSS